ncbi:MAG: AbrB/MazE/SpoVT family DNA-binding domain-containing protein [Nanoarchaeota archaeon]|nr:AbrB/MazE/SpoVT family DNA-binding domain-containing protein [Nanoarchaeota archaeon]MBU1322368.1 AbrB/MazE/SpoVT family DNA-binding domain-containing protein [Nanoarchaeota archaeon]MBU1598395.1 AbrB/MazE/SpoVT family DNA-binding domain-containing protein [Nanoarchaeota archaeon]MBU2440772.1 AbrB/MazE/SpoVT family DNA-binding domain-containing protein [Nanoarchaeota archaeon]
MEAMIEMGKISSRGQIAIPSDMRTHLGLEEGTKVLFFVENDTLLMRKVKPETWEELTRPLKDAKKKIKEKDVNALIHRMRKDARNT